MFVEYDENENTVKLIDDLFFDVIFEVKVWTSAEVNVIINFFMLYSSIISVS